MRIAPGLPGDLPPRIEVRANTSDIQPLQKRSNSLASGFIDRDCHDLQRIVGVPLLKFFKQRQFPAAGRTPRRPEIHQNRLLSKCLQGHKLSVDSLERQLRDFSQWAQFDELRTGGSQERRAVGGHPNLRVCTGANGHAEHSGSKDPARHCISLVVHIVVFLAGVVTAAARSTAWGCNRTIVHDASVAIPRRLELPTCDSESGVALEPVGGRKQTACATNLCQI